jgi:hypothetical protein
MKTVRLPIDQLGIKGSMCAWKGCTARTPNPDLPPDWRWLLLYWKRTPALETTDIDEGTWDRDACLCPQHARELHRRLLKDIGR